MKHTLNCIVQIKQIMNKKYDKYEYFANNKQSMLVDGDLLVYKITSSLEEPIDWGDDIWTLHLTLEKVNNY